jgi:hypothetical protein
MMGESRCPTCGALVSADAEWCGQCFSPLERAGARTEAEGPATPAPTGTAGPKAIRGTSCSACGTPFGRLLAEPKAAPEIEAQTAAVWSMIWPGLGHWKLGRRADAVARFALLPGRSGLGSRELLWTSAGLVSCRS